LEQQSLEYGGGSEGGGKGALVSIEKSLTLTANANDQTLFQPIPINDKATRYKGGGDARKKDGAGNGLGIGKPGDPAPTLTSGDRHAVATFALQRSNEYKESNKSHTLARRDYKGPTDLVCIDCRNLCENEISGTLQSKNQGGYSLNYQNPVRIGYKVRRLTPTEYERLQGLPNGWTAGGSDSARYKAIGNGMAQPCADFVMKSILREITEED
jgi:DNA (cytosine-5)-methyltransferase 1